MLVFNNQTGQWQSQGGWQGQGWSRAAASGGGGGGSAQSIVLAGASNQYLQTTWSHAPTDATRLTISYWIKLASIPSVDTGLFSTASTSSVIFMEKLFAGGNTIRTNDDQGNVFAYDTAVTEDTTTWHHYCFAYDSNAAAGSRIKIYIDGTTVSTATTDPSAGFNWQATPNGVQSVLGATVWLTTRSLDAKFAYVYLIDGQTLTPSSFFSGGHPVAYVGTYGNNGFFLNGSGSNFNDQSGNGNNWTGVNSPTFSADVPT